MPTVESGNVLFGQVVPYCPTVWMNEMPRFYVGKPLLHHYMSDLAHLSDFDSLVIGLSKSER